jgi:hypothetical protein
MTIPTAPARSSLVLLAILGLAAAPTARAHEAPNGFYVEGGGGIEYWSIPAVEAFIDPSLRQRGDSDGSFWAETAFLRFGFVDGDGTRFPDPLGRDARIEAGVRWADGDSDESVFSAAGLGFFQINNPVGPANGTLTPTTGRFETDLESWEADLLYRTDVPFNDWLILSPYLGIGYAYLDVENEYSLVTGGMDVSNTFGLEDEIEAHFGGIVLGGDAELHPIDLLSFRLGVRADLMAVTAKLEADQNLFVGGTQRRNAETDHDVDFAARVGTQLGMALHLGPVELGIDGDVRYHSYMPTAEHPTSFTHRTSHVGNRSAWTASVMGRITILIP